MCIIGEYREEWILQTHNAAVRVAAGCKDLHHTGCRQSLCLQCGLKSSCSSWRTLKSISHSTSAERRQRRCGKQRENTAAGTAKYLAIAAPPIVPTQQTAVQPLRDSAGGNVVGEQHHWLLQNMQPTCTGQLEQPAAPAAHDSLAVSGTSVADAVSEENHGPIAKKSLGRELALPGFQLLGKGSVWACFQTAKHIHRLCRPGASVCADRS